MNKNEQLISDLAMIARNAIDKIIDLEKAKQKPVCAWVGLTNEQIMDCTHHMAKENGVWIVTDNGLLEFAHILEETIRSKNT